MRDFIREIPSDTTINKIELEQTTLNIFLTFYTEDKYLMIFTNIFGYKLMPEWNLPEGIEGVEIKTKSIFMDEVKTAIENDKQLLDNAKSFTFINNNVTVIEIIANSYILEKL